MLAHYHRARLFAVMRDIKRGMMLTLPHLHLSSRVHALLQASLKQQDKINPHFHSWKHGGPKSNTQESARSFFKHNGSREEERGIGK